MNLLHTTLFLFLLQLNVSTSRQVNSREGRITGGHEARAHSNPYIVSLQSRFLWWRTRLCSGSILSQRWILSAGHCITDSWARWFSMDAIVGAHSLAEISSSQIYSISHRIAHPMYRGGVGPYDIGMLKTARKIQYTQNVQPIQLPINNPELKADDKLLIMGWGALSSNIFLMELPNMLQEVEVSYLPYYECYKAVDMIIEKYESNPLKKKANICTGPITGGIAGCSGDSGGPLVQYVWTSSDKEETTTSMSISISPIPMTTDRPSSTTIGSTSSPIPMTTDRPPSTSTGSTSSPIPMTTDRPASTTAGSTSSPISMSTNDGPPSTATGSTFSPIPMTTDRPVSTTAGSTSSPIPMTTDRPSSTTTGSTSSPTTGSTSSPNPMTTERLSTTTVVSTSSPTSITTDRQSSTTTGSTSSLTPLTSDISVMTKRLLRSLSDNMIPTVVGVVSWGVVPCGDKGAPTVYSNVSNYMDFINKYLNSS